MQSDLLHIFFDLDTGSDYPDGDEWFIVDMLFPYDVSIPDNLKGSDHFIPLFQLMVKKLSGIIVN